MSTDTYVDEDEDNRELLILYATETGNALDVAEQIAHEARRRFISARLASVDTYPLENLIHEPLVVFCVSTTGAGSEPRSMTPMWTALLRSNLPQDLFDELHFAVFGLGDSAYEKFCWAAKKLSRRLQSLGGHEICVRGEGDEQDQLGIEGALDNWLPKLFLSLEDFLPPPPDKEFADPEALPPPRIRISSIGGPSSSRSGLVKRDTLLHRDGYHNVSVKCNKRITASDWYQDVRHIELDLDEEVLYDAGDVAVVHPEVPANDVEVVLRDLGWIDSADEPFSFSLSDNLWHIPDNIPRTTTLRQLFSKYLDTSSVPRRSFFRILRHFSDDETEREKLEEFCTTEGADELYEYTTRVRRTIREVISEFRSLKVSKEYIFDLFPLLRPRQFSIASSAFVHEKQVHICLAVVRYKTKLKIIRRGICSNYLASLQLGMRLQIGIQKGFLSVPKDPETPIVCVGPGTGIAPMRAVIEQRVHEKSKRNYLFFGCRSKEKDHHYGEEWQSLVDRGYLRYRAAFSRDGPEGQKRIYVQDLMLEDAEILWKVLGQENGWMYISGSSNKMPAAVKSAVATAAKVVGGKSEDEAKEFVKNLQDTGRLFEECWS